MSIFFSSFCNKQHIQQLFQIRHCGSSRFPEEQGQRVGGRVVAVRTSRGFITAWTKNEIPSYSNNHSFPSIPQYSHIIHISGIIQSDERRRGMPNDNKVPQDISIPFQSLSSFLLSSSLTVSTSSTIFTRLRNAAAVSCQRPPG